MNQTLHVAIRQSEPINIDVQLQCRPGEMLALVGPSGSGKSTVLRSIAGLHPCQQAYISCGQTCWEDPRRGIRLAPQQRRVGMVFQNYALFPHKNVLQNVLLAMQDVPAALRQEQALEWLARTNMSGLQHRRPDELSGGQRQRVALARALAREPAVLLLDEPFSAVDQQTRRKLYREMARLRRDLPIPIVLVTHDIGEVQQLADTLCLIHRGRTLQYGDVQQVISQPDSKESARLLGHQNLLPARILQHQSTHTIFALGSGERLIGPRSSQVPGSEVTLLVPPTTISIITRENQHTVSNQLRGRVSDAVALGDELSVRLKLETVTKALRFRIAQNHARQLGIRTGSVLDITISHTDIHVIHDRSNASSPRLQHIRHGG